MTEPTKPVKLDIMNELGSKASFHLTLAPAVFELEPGQKQTVQILVRCDQPHKTQTFYVPGGVEK